MRRGKKKERSKPTALAPLVSIEVIERRIHLIRGQKVMLDRDLASLYAVRSIALRQQVKRNIGRFPADFMFRLSKEEAEALVSQDVIPSRGNLGGFLPYAFTEQGVAMLSSVLRSQRAVRVNILIMRAFVKIREILSSRKEIRRKLEELEKKYESHDLQIHSIFEAIRKLITAESARPRRRIGFVTPKRVSP
ncbi:MAG TPA: ORF6N domain-containing protein [Terriglobia bacterium]|nr:ORF6N domain-containing protein [Terriglobia bacterium]